MFRPIPAIIRFSSERVLVFIRLMRLCNDGEISSSVVFIITTIKRHGCNENRHLRKHCTPSQHNTHITEHPPKPCLLIVVIMKATDDEISPSLHNRINLTNTNTLSDENLMMAGIGRNM